ncbi:hypothetical protein HBB16_20520 [Pseudonocardia sp. MCCB 268]|nr:hypothetical protein [Pseudonocardia cytotoxica]
MLMIAGCSAPRRSPSCSAGSACSAPPSGRSGAGSCCAPSPCCPRWSSAAC